MARPSDEQQRALAGLLGLGDHSARKSHYPELSARLDELEAERQALPPLLQPTLPQPTAGNPLPGRRMLVLDNEVSILESMGALLGQWGCEVVTATDQQGALQALEGRAPELILADFHLDHGVVGCDVVRQLREHYASAIPAVIITADRSDQCRRSLRKLGAPLLNKPVKPGKLRAVLSQLLG